MTTLAFLHVLSLGFWGGCVGAEMVMEVLAWRDPALAPAVARIHDRIDRFVELPLLCAVLATGLAQLEPSRLSGLYLLKVGLGLTALGANFACLAPVFRRAAAARAGDAAAVRAQSRRVFIAFAVGFPAALGALALGAQRLG